MATVTCKASVRFDRFTRANLRLLHAVLLVAERTTEVEQVVVTSGSDGRHMATSQHYRGAAIDLRVHNFPSQAAVSRFAAALRAELGPAFTVLYEAKGTPNAHLHLQPRRGTVYEGPV